MNTVAYLQEFIDSLLDEELTGHAANRAQFIKDKIAQHWKGLPGYPEIDPWLEKLAAVDPTQKKIYLPWIAKMCLKAPNENRTEDLDRVGEDLRAFEVHKAQIANKDINAYKSFNDLFDVIAPFLAPKKKSKEELAAEKDAKRLEKIKSEITTVYAGPEGWIRIPKTVESAKFLGQNTRWCTAADSNNMFSYYNKSDVLFVIYDKATKKRHQLHIDSGQFADEADRNQGMKTVPEWAWDHIINWYKANNPNLSIKHLMTLGVHSQENLAAGTVHSDLLDLMKLYNVT